MKRSQRPFVSVIMPMRNEGKYIKACLRSLLQCSYPADRWEIILADGMSEDNTRQEVAEVAATSRVPIIVVDNPRRVTPFGLNAALAHTRGSIIIRVDAHSVYGKDYIVRCVEALEERQVDNVGGIMAAIPGAETTMGQAIAYAMMHPFGVGNSLLRVGKESQEVDSVPFGCYRAEVFQRIGLFDERLVRNQDFEFNQRLRRAEGKIFLDLRIKLHYYSRPTLASLLKQSWSNGFWNALCHATHPYTMCFRHVAPLVFSLGAAVALVLLGWNLTFTAPTWLKYLAWPLWSVYLAYLTVNFAVATQLSSRHGWRLWPALCVLFPAFHFVNGAGLTLGWTRALLRRYPWRPEDHAPTWEEARKAHRARLAA